MALALVLSKKKEHTEVEPLKIRIDKGTHKIVGDKDTGLMSIARSHIAFVGNGKDQTTLCGKIEVVNQQNVTFEELTLTNPERPEPANNFWGEFASVLYLRGSETNVGLSRCVVKGSRHVGMRMRGGATATATQCVFTENRSCGVSCYGSNTKARLNDCKIHHNGMGGLTAGDHAVVDLHGTKTDVHTNEIHGILATQFAKVSIHLLFQHGTSHGNVGEDRVQLFGGSIANINTDGTFTHLDLEEEEEEEEEEMDEEEEAALAAAYEEEQEFWESFIADYDAEEEEEEEEEDEDEEDEEDEEDIFVIDLT